MPLQITIERNQKITRKIELMPGDEPYPLPYYDPHGRFKHQAARIAIFNCLDNDCGGEIRTVGLRDIHIVENKIIVPTALLNQVKAEGICFGDAISFPVETSIGQQARITAKHVGQHAFIGFKN